MAVGNYQRLFGMTTIGMRVIVARNDVRPAEIDHPVLFKPKLVRADIALKALTAHWDAARADVQAVTTWDRCGRSRRRPHQLTQQSPS